MKATLTVGKDGVDIVEINDQPVGGNDDENPMPDEDLPDLGSAMDDIYAPK